VKDLQYVLRNTPDTVIKEVSQDHAQDPFVLYRRKYRLRTKEFTNESEMIEFFGGKKVVVRDCEDMVFKYVVDHWIHADEIIKKETG